MGPLDSEGIVTVAAVVAVVVVTVGLCVIPVRRRWLALMIPIRLAAIATASLAVAIGLIVLRPVTVSPIISEGCDTGYIVAESSFLLSGWGTVYRQDGILVTKVASTGGDDGFAPFANDAYVVRDDGTDLRVWYDIGDASGRPIDASARPPSFTLAKLTHRHASCGLSGGQIGAGSVTPSPTSTTEAARAVDEEMARMTSLTIASAVGPVTDAGRVPVDPAAVTATAGACDASGSRRVVTLELRTGDNARSATQILAAWSAVGYRKDRAMGSDIRHSSTRSVESLTLHDTTTIDGSIHLTILSRCLPSG